jgi:hypothetical protein
MLIGLAPEENVGDQVIFQSERGNIVGSTFSSGASPISIL